MTSKQRAYLRSLANNLETILYVGINGVTPATVHDASQALEARELIKCCVTQGAELSAREACALLCEQLLHVEKIAADRRERFAETGKPRRSCFDRGAVPVDPVKLSALGQLFQHGFGMAAAAERSVHKNAAALWLQQRNDCVPQDWNVVKAAHMPSPAR